MLQSAAWLLFILGIGHILYGLVAFRAPIRAAIGEGLIGKFMGDDQRRLAFWFVIVGPMLACLGHVALHAVANLDLILIRIVGWYVLGAAALGVLALPKSPFWLALLPAALLIATGHGWLAP